MARIMVVEDEILLALQIEFILKDRGHEVMICGDGRTAIDSIGRFSPDLIVTDYMMPLMNGGELIARIRGDEETRRIPVILMSSAFEKTVSDTEYDYFLQKPFVEPEFLGLVDIALEESGSPGQN